MTKENGDLLLLVWRWEEVTWDDTLREITYTNSAKPRATPITIREGEVITVGGIFLTTDPAIRWLATPQPTCNGRWYAVDFVELDS